MDWKEIERKLAGDPSTFTHETCTPEEWAAMTERMNERKSRAATLEAIHEWANRTVMLPSGLLSAGFCATLNAAHLKREGKLVHRE